MKRLIESMRMNGVGIRSTKLSLVLKNLLIFLVLSLCYNTNVLANEEQDEFESQQFLFMMTEGYNQERGEVQISFTSLYMDRQRLKDGDEVKKKNQWEWIPSIEYGLFDWLEIEVEVPFGQVYKWTTEDGETTKLNQTGIGDVGTGVRINILKEEPDEWWSHTLSAGFELSWPTGDWKKDLGTNRFGWETNLALSKTTERWAWHVLGGFGMTDNAREQGESQKSDVQEVEIGGALVNRAIDKLDLICELFAEFEREKTTTNENHGTECYVVPGVGYKPIRNFEIGLGVPVGLTNTSYDWGIIAKLQYEW